MFERLWRILEDVAITARSWAATAAARGLAAVHNRLNWLAEQVPIGQPYLSDAVRWATDFWFWQSQHTIGQIMSNPRKEARLAQIQLWMEWQVHDMGQIAQLYEGKVIRADLAIKLLQDAMWGELLSHRHTWGWWWRMNTMEPPFPAFVIGTPAEAALEQASVAAGIARRYIGLAEAVGRLTFRQNSERVWKYVQREDEEVGRWVRLRREGPRRASGRGVGPPGSREAPKTPQEGV